MSGSTVVTPENLDKITAALAQLDQAEKEVALAKRAGLDQLPGGERIATAQADIDKYRAQLLAIRNTYFPNAT